MRFAGQPASVEEAIIARLLRVAVADGVIDVSPQVIHIGDTVRITDGPLVGLEGSYIQAHGEIRASVLPQILCSERVVRVTLEQLQTTAWPCMH